MTEEPIEAVVARAKSGEPKTWGYDPYRLEMDAVRLAREVELLQECELRLAAMTEWQMEMQVERNSLLAERDEARAELRSMSEEWRNSGTLLHERELQLAASMRQTSEARAEAREPIADVLARVLGLEHSGSEDPLIDDAVLLAREVGRLTQDGNESTALVVRLLNERDEAREVEQQLQVVNDKLEDAIEELDERHGKVVLERDEARADNAALLAAVIEVRNELWEVEPDYTGAVRRLAEASHGDHPGAAILERQERLRATIRRIPHAGLCWSLTVNGGHCDCWRRHALDALHDDNLGEQTMTLTEAREPIADVLARVLAEATRQLHPDYARRADVRLAREVERLLARQERLRAVVRQAGKPCDCFVEQELAYDTHTCDLRPLLDALHDGDLGEQP